MTQHPIDSNVIAARIREFIARDILFSSGAFPYDDDASFLEEGIIDSLGVMELVGFVQKEFEFPVEQDDVLPENFGSVASLTQYVAARARAPVANS